MDAAANLCIVQNTRRWAELDVAVSIELAAAESIVSTAFHDIHIIGRNKAEPKIVPINVTILFITPDSCQELIDDLMPRFRELYHQ